MIDLNLVCTYGPPYIIRVSNYVLADPGVQGDRPLWSGASNKLCTYMYFPQKENICLCKDGGKQQL